MIFRQDLRGWKNFPGKEGKDIQDKGKAYPRTEHQEGRCQSDINKMVEGQFQALVLYQKSNRNG